MLTKKEIEFEDFLNQLEKDHLADPELHELVNGYDFTNDPYPRFYSIKAERHLGLAVEKMDVGKRLHLLNEIPKSINHMFVYSKRNDHLYSFIRQNDEYGCSVFMLKKARKVRKFYGDKYIQPRMKRNYQKITVIYWF